MKSYLRTKRDHVVIAIACIGLAVLALAWLHVTVIDWISGREEYNTPIPFVISGVLGLAFGLWPPSRLLSGWKKHIVRAIVFAACLAPLPFGPEGTLLPAAIGLLYPPSFLMCPQGVLLTFASALLISIASSCLWCIVWPEKD